MTVAGTLDNVEILESDLLFCVAVFCTSTGS